MPQNEHSPLIFGNAFGRSNSVMVKIHSILQLPASHSSCIIIQLERDAVHQGVANRKKVTFIIVLYRNARRQACRKTFLVQSYQLGSGGE